MIIVPMLRVGMQFWTLCVLFVALRVTYIVPQLLRYAERQELHANAEWHDSRPNLCITTRTNTRVRAVDTIKRFSSFAEFYPFYLAEHSSSTSRRLHFVGTSLVIFLLAFGVGSGRWGLLWWLPVAGYGFAWAGHFFFEKNRPATFKHPFYSLLGDFVMYRDMLLGKVPF